jgi:hypothetical protein
VTTEGVQIGIESATDAGSGTDPCPPADAATDAALLALQRGTPLPRRASVDPPNALTSADTCALVTPADLAAVPGLDPARVTAGTAHWSCRWGTGPGTTTASPVVAVVVNRVGRATPTTRIAGRPATVTPRDGSCAVALVQRTYPATDGTERTELLDVRVYGGRPSDQLCADATRLAAAAAPRLPAP